MKSRFLKIIENVFIPADDDEVILRKTEWIQNIEKKVKPVLENYLKMLTEIYENMDDYTDEQIDNLVLRKLFTKTDDGLLSFYDLPNNRYDKFHSIYWHWNRSEFTSKETVKKLINNISSALENLSINVNENIFIPADDDEVKQRRKDAAIPMLQDYLDLLNKKRNPSVNLATSDGLSRVVEIFGDSYNWKSYFGEDFCYDLQNVWGKWNGGQLSEEEVIEWLKRDIEIELESLKNSLNENVFIPADEDEVLQRIIDSGKAQLKELEQKYNTKIEIGDYIHDTTPLFDDAFFTSDINKPKRRNNYYKISEIRFESYGAQIICIAKYPPKAYSGSYFVSELIDSNYYTLRFIKEDQALREITELIDKPRENYHANLRPGQ